MAENSKKNSPTIKSIAFALIVGLIAIFTYAHESAHPSRKSFGSGGSSSGKFRGRAVIQPSYTSSNSGPKTYYAIPLNSGIYSIDSSYSANSSPITNSILVATINNPSFYPDSSSYNLVGYADNYSTEQGNQMVATQGSMSGLLTASLGNNQSVWIPSTSSGNNQSILIPGNGNGKPGLPWFFLPSIGLNSNGVTTTTTHVSSGTSTSFTLYFIPNKTTAQDTGKLPPGSAALVPEPETYAMFLAGLGMLAGLTWRKKYRPNQG